MKKNILETIKEMREYVEGHGDAHAANAIIKWADELEAQHKKLQDFIEKRKNLASTTASEFKRINTRDTQENYHYYTGASQAYSAIRDWIGAPVPKLKKLTFRNNFGVHLYEVVGVATTSFECVHIGKKTFPVTWKEVDVEHGMDGTSAVYKQCFIDVETDLGTFAVPLCDIMKDKDVFV